VVLPSGNTQASPQPHIGRSGASFFVVVLFFVFHSITPTTHSLDNGLARTPPMGWLSWERFGCQINCTDHPDLCISETLYLTMGRLLVEQGFQRAGYTYVNVDDCWSATERDPTSGRLVADAERFPLGIRHLSGRLHSWGLRLGLYGDIGTETCGGYPGFHDHFELDAQTLADWGVDSIKVDACHADESLFNVTYPAFGRALNRTGRPILYSCSWPNDYYEEHHHYEDPDYLNHGIKQTCNSWRNYFDVFDSWESISRIIDFWARIGPGDVMVRAAGPGHWNDPDMLVVGNPGLSPSEQQSQFSLWAIFAAPLLFSNDLRTLSDESRSILLNTEIIAVNQDVLGRQGWCAEHDPSAYSRVWIRELQPSWWGGTTTTTTTACPPGGSDRWAVVLQNYNTIFNAKVITFRPDRHLPTPLGQGREGGGGDAIAWKCFSVRDLVRKADLGVYDGEFSATIDESSVGTFLVTRGVECNALLA
jgi:alpha-N-acetylgalactosaminidase